MSRAETCGNHRQTRSIVCKLPVAGASLLQEKNLFEFLQKDLEKNTDCLHEMLEKDPLLGSVQGMQLLTRMPLKLCSTSQDFDRMFFNPAEGQQLSQADVHQNFKVFRTLARRGFLLLGFGSPQNRAQSFGLEVDTTSSTSPICGRK